MFKLLYLAEICNLMSAFQFENGFHILLSGHYPCVMYMVGDICRWIAVFDGVERGSRVACKWTSVSYQ